MPDWNEFTKQAIDPGPEEDAEIVPDEPAPQKLPKAYEKNETPPPGTIVNEVA